MEPKDMCNACFELYMYGSTNVHTYELKTTGACFGLHPNSKENWIPYRPNAVFWDNRLKGMVDKDASAAATTTTRSARERVPLNHFIAEPAGSKPMVFQQQVSLSRKRKSRQATRNIDVEKKDILSRISSLPMQEMDSILSPFITLTQRTQNGRVALAKKIRKAGGNEGPMRLSTNGTSSTAVSLSSKTYQEATIGLAAMLDPSNLKAAFTRLKSARTPLVYRNHSNSRQREVVDTVQKLGTIPDEEQQLSLQQQNPPPRRLDQQLQQTTAASEERYKIHKSPQQDKRLGRRSMTKVPLPQILAAKNAIGPIQMEHLQSLSTNAERRPFFAAMHRGGHSRPAINQST